MSITKTKRFKILSRDNHTCQYCGQSAPNVQLQVDHIFPVSKGGLNEDENLITSCWACNIGKSDKTRINFTYKTFPTMEDIDIAMVQFEEMEFIIDRCRMMFGWNYTKPLFSVIYVMRKHMPVQSIMELMEDAYLELRDSPNVSDRVPSVITWDAFMGVMESRMHNDFYRLKDTYQELGSTYN